MNRHVTRFLTVILLLAAPAVASAAGGSLSGYAWSSSAGWVNFNPTHGGVTIDPVSGSLSGWAWAENIGWIHLAAESGNYGVTTGGGEGGRRYYLPLIFKS